MTAKNTIIILAPRWRDRTILVADWKIATENQIIITAKRVNGSLFYPNPIIVSGAKLKTYPTEKKPYGTMRIVKLDDLINE